MDKFLQFPKVLPPQTHSAAHATLPSCTKSTSQHPAVAFAMHAGIQARWCSSCASRHYARAAGQEYVTRQIQNRSLFLRRLHAPLHQGGWQAFDRPPFSGTEQLDMRSD